MTALCTRHPEVAAEFERGHFAVKKNKKQKFSSIAIDQVHEQHNVKGDRSAVGLTNNPDALRRWMIAGPEVAWVIKEFHAQ